MKLLPVASHYKYWNAAVMVLSLLSRHHSHAKRLGEDGRDLEQAQGQGLDGRDITYVPIQITPEKGYTGWLAQDGDAAHYTMTIPYDGESVWTFQKVGMYGTTEINQLKSEKTGLCMEMEDGVHSNRYRSIYMKQCKVSETRQWWIYTGDFRLNGQGGEWGKFYNLGTSRALGVSGGCTGGVFDFRHGSDIEGQPELSCGPEFEGDGTTNDQQMWFVYESDAGNTFFISKRAARKYYWVTDRGDGSVGATFGAGIFEGDTDAWASSRWGFYHVAGNTFSFLIVNQESKQCLQIDDRGSSDYRTTRMVDCDTSDYTQRYRVRYSNILNGDKFRIENWGTDKYLGFPCNTNLQDDDGNHVNIEGQPYNSCGKWDHIAQQFLGTELIISYEGCKAPLGTLCEP